MLNTFAGLSIAQCLILLLSFTEMEPQKIWRDALDCILDSRGMKKYVWNSGSLCIVGINMYSINKKAQRTKHDYLTLTISFCSYSYMCTRYTENKHCEQVGLHLSGLNSDLKSFHF